MILPLTTSRSDPLPRPPSVEVEGDDESFIVVVEVDDVEEVDVEVEVVDVEVEVVEVEVEEVDVEVVDVEVVVVVVVVTVSRLFSSPGVPPVKILSAQLESPFSTE